MPFVKPTPATFKVHLLGERSSVVHLFDCLAQLGLRDRDGAYPNSECVIVEVLSKKTCIRLEFWDLALSSEFSNSIPTLHLRPDVVLILSPCDKSTEKYATSNTIQQELMGACRILVAMDSDGPKAQQYNIAASAKNCGCNAYGALSSNSVRSVVDLINIIKRCLIMSGKKLYRSLDHELNTVNLQVDRKCVANSTMCYERNSIG